MAEAEYISKEAALACFNDWIDRYGHEHSADEMAEYQRIEDLLPADVVEVVRCKDCRFYYKDEDGYEMCDASEGYDHISADGFCAWAKRRADDDTNSSNPSKVP